MNEPLNIIYISQGNIPSKWAHTFQAMKMAEALAGCAGTLTLLTGGPILPPPVPAVDLAEWYGLRRLFPIVRLPVHWRLPAPLFEGYRYPLFDLAAALYTRLRSPDLVYTRSPYAGYLSAKLGLRTIVETHIHTDHPEFHRVAAACRTRSCLGLVTVTSFLRDSYVDAGIPDRKIVVCEDGVDLRPFDDLPSQEVLRRELGLPLERTVATYCGHLYDHKGVEHVIGASMLVPEVLFCLVGGWPDDIRRCQAMAEGLENVRFSGFVPNSLVPKYLAASDILLLPNSMRYAQAYSTSPLKLFEYMASGRPVVAARIPALEGLLRHEKNAYLVEPDSSESMAEAVRRLQGDKGLALRIAEQARCDVECFTWERRFQRILDYFGSRQW